MKYFCFLIFLIFSLSGCATNTVYINSSRTTEEIQKDTNTCEAEVNSSDFKDSDLKRNKLNQCMEKKGYKAVSEGEAEKIQGFKGLWVKPGVDFKPYEAIFIDKVDVKDAEIKETQLPSAKVSKEELNNLGSQMSKRFANALGGVIQVLSNEKEASGKKTLKLSLKLTEAGQADVLLNMASEAIPIDGIDIGSEGMLSFKGEIADYASGEKLITFHDNAKEDKNASLIGHENFSAWSHAYNIMDYWADHFAVLLAKLRNKEYKSQIGIKLF